MGVKECELLEACGFFRRYRNELVPVCRRAIELYCRGSMQSGCARKAYRTRTWLMPQDSMMPSGTMLLE